MSFVDWIEAGRPIDMDGGTVQGVGSVLLSYNLATQEQLDELGVFIETAITDAETQTGVPRDAWTITIDVTEFVAGVSAVVGGTVTAPDGQSIPGFEPSTDTWKYLDGQWLISC